MRTVPEGATTNVWWYVPREKGQKYLSFDFRKPKILVDGKYINWGIYLSYTAGHLAGDVTTPLPGLYTLRLPDYDGEKKSDQLIIRNYNLGLYMGDIVCSREPPENRAEFIEKNGKWAVRVTLEEKCEDVSCKILWDWGVGPEPFSADGKSSFEMKPVDAARTVWAGVMPAPASGQKRNKEGHLPHPFVRVTVLGGSIDKPILTWLDRKN